MFPFLCEPVYDCAGCNVEAYIPRVTGDASLPDPSLTNGSKHPCHLPVGRVHLVTMVYSVFYATIRVGKADRVHCGGCMRPASYFVLSRSIVSHRLVSYLMNCDRKGGSGVWWWLCAACFICSPATVHCVASARLSEKLQNRRKSATAQWVGPNLFPMLDVKCALPPPPNVLHQARQPVTCSFHFVFDIE